MYEIQYTKQMSRDLDRMRRRGKDLRKLFTVINRLAAGQPLTQKNRDHKLSGNLRNFRECHIEPDWLLIYQIFEDKLILSCTATGTHSDLLKE